MNIDVITLFPGMFDALTEFGAGIHEILPKTAIEPLMTDLMAVVRAW